MFTSKPALWARTLLLLAALVCGLRAAPNPFVGRWALTIAPNSPGWLEVKDANGQLSGSLLWVAGSVLPVASVSVANDTLTVTRIREVDTKDASGRTTKAKLADTLTARANGEVLTGALALARLDGKEGQRITFSGRRIPPVPPAPDLSKVKFSAPIALFNGKDLTGWRVLEGNAKNAWTVENGTLVNRPPEAAPGQPHVRTANLRTDAEFEDFNLKLEVSVPKGSNSGVYLRGIYEVQVFDSYGKPLDSHNMGAIYSRITPSVAAEKPAGEWQTLDITLVDRHATVVLNGTKIIDNQPLEGCTGGALWSDEFRPGPLYLQGDHGAVSYRNLVLRRVEK